MAADRLDARGVGQAPSTSRYNDGVQVRKDAQAADAKAARNAELLKGKHLKGPVGVTASAQQRYNEYDAKRAEKAYKELGKTKHIPTSKQKLMSEAKDEIEYINSSRGTNKEGALKVGISCAHDAIVFGTPQAIDFLVANATYGRSEGYKAPVPKSATANEAYATPIIEITWANVHATFSQILSGSVSVKDLLARPLGKEERVAVWVYSMQHKFTDTHKLTAKEEATCKQLYLDAVNNGNFNMDYFAPGGSCCVLM